MLISVKTIICTVIAALLCSFSVQVQAADPSETQVTAAMIFNFSKFVEWPADALSGNVPLHICIAGSNPFNNSGDKYQGKISGGKMIKIRTVTSPQEVTGCNILYIDQSEQTELNSYLQQANQSPILTVSNIGQFASHNGIIGFFKQDDRLRFEINHEKAKRSRLTISSNMLKLARIVR